MVVSGSAGAAGLLQNEGPTLSEVVLCFFPEISRSDMMLSLGSPRSLWSSRSSV